MLKYIQWSRSISAKYQWLLLPTMALVLAAFGLYVAYLERQRAMAANWEMADILTRKTNAALINWIKEQIRLAETIAADPRIVAACREPTNATARAAAQVYLDAMHQRYPYNENLPIAIRLADDQSFPLPAGDRTVTIKNGNFFLDTVEGKTLGKCGPHFSYIQAVFGGQPYFICEVYPSILRGNPIFVVAAPVRQDGAVIGVAVVAPRMDFFTQAFVEDCRVGRTGFMVMVDERGMIISHPEKDLILNTNAQAKVADVMQQIQAGRVRFQAVFDGRIKDYSVARFTSDDFNILHDWYLVFGREHAEIVAEAGEFLKRVFLCLAFLAVLLGLLTYALTRIIVSRPLGRLTAVAHRVAGGDLAQEAACGGRCDEIGVLCQALNGMTASLRRQTRHIREAVDVLESSTTQITETSQRQESVIRANNASTHQVAAAVNEISATAKDLVQTMKTVQAGSSTTAALADTGRGSLALMDESMRVLDAATRDISGRLAQIADKAGSIGSVVNTIAKVSDQTNLLSLNASIEAEKAGAYGKGFSVVAREIRRLADQTASSTQHIAQTTQAMQQAVSAGVMEMDKFAGEVRRNVATVEQIHGQLLKIIGQVQELAPQFSMVNDGMQAQSDGAGHISTAMAQLSAGAQQSAESLDQLNQATRQVRAAALNLKQELDRFKI